MNRTISAENLGPITALEFALQSPGVTVLVAPNGSGKSILLEAVQAAAKGEGKLPLRDRTRKGKVEAFGAVITIGGTCRHTGEFEVTNLEGRFDLAALVDPRIKTPAAADKARIKALVSLTGAEASVNLFRSHDAFDDFDTVVTSASIETDDLIDMATRIKADYDAAALVRERQAEREQGAATALIPKADLDLTEESDATVLQAAYNERRDELTRLEEQARNAKLFREQAERSKAILAKLGADQLDTERKQVVHDMASAKEAIEGKTERINALRLQIRGLEAEIDHCKSAIKSGDVRLQEIDKQSKLVDEAKAVLAKSAITPPEQSDIDDAKTEVELAQAAIEKGALIRQAKADASKVHEHRRNAKAASEKAARYRDAGKATDDVLSSCIKCPQLRVESDGKTARLVTDTARGKSIQYHDLSDGERWTIAIDIGADQVGKGGLLVISQIGWEGIDGAHRLAIHQHAVNRGVYILTAEAASDPNATNEIVPTPMAPVKPEAKPAPAKLTPKPLPSKPGPKSAAKTASKPMADELPDDGDEIPF